MKTKTSIIVCLCLLSLTPTFGQSGTSFSERVAAIQAGQKTQQASATLTRFSLDFPGGTPKQLVAAIEKATGKPLNAIIADENNDIRIPPLKMTDVTVPQLFAALTKMSIKRDNGNVISSYGFQTEGAQPTEDSIWQFFAYDNSHSPSSLTRFDLDFPGGTPRQLVAAIEKAMGKPLNAIIPAEYSDVQLPSLKMNNVDVWQLFQALEQASSKSEAYLTHAPGPSPAYQIRNSTYGFKTQGQLTDDSVWYFYVNKTPLPPVSPSKACRFYSLAPYLEAGYTVDDITTAIQTAWKMLGDKDTPTISFHKETRLLIAVGEPGKLETIDAALKALDRPKAKAEAK